jgi:hypothetical protein
MGWGRRMMEERMAIKDNLSLNDQNSKMDVKLIRRTT